MNLLFLSGFSNELRTSVPESRLVLGALSVGLAELAKSNTLRSVAQIFA